MISDNRISCIHVFRYCFLTFQWPDYKGRWSFPTWEATVRSLRASSLTTSPWSKFGFLDPKVIDSLDLIVLPKYRLPVQHLFRRLRDGVAVEFVHLSLIRELCAGATLVPACSAKITFFTMITHALGSTRRISRWRNNLQLSPDHLSLISQSDFWFFRFQSAPYALPRSP